VIVPLFLPASGAFSCGAKIRVICNALWRNLRTFLVFLYLNLLTAVGYDRQTAALPQLPPHLAGYLELNKSVLP
jgi:hypothetical protein